MSDTPPGADATHGSSIHTVRTERMATGGEAVARLDDGCVVFVRGAVDGETVQIELTERRKRFARGQVVTVIEPSSDRAPLTCDHAAGDCGGCDWLFIAPDAQRRAKVDIVTDQLVRLGGITDPVVRHRAERAGRRTSVRCLVTDGRAGFRGHRQSDGFAAASCQAAHPDVESLMVHGRYPGAREVTLRVAPATGERLALLHGDGAARPELPTDVLVTSSPDGAGITQVVAGLRFFVSAGSFFQTSDRGAETLIAAVADALDGSTGPVVDLYGGVGLLGAAVAGDRLATLVESNPYACADARRNLGGGVEVVHERVERWRPRSACEAVIADPARAGLGADGVASIEACRAERLALVSCDPASLGRDVGLLRDAGWHLVHSEVVDMFADTSRIEVVSRLER